MKKLGFPLVIISVMVVTACSQGSYLADVPALQQEAGTWPRCISGCTANDVEINSVWLDVSAGNYTLGETVTHNVSMDLYFHRQNTYCIVVVADLWEGGVLQEADWTSSIIGYHSGSGNYNYAMGTVNWTYGKLFEMRNVLVMWGPNSPKGGICPTDCTEYNAASKCNQVAAFIVTTPLVVDFEFDEVCLCNNTTFTDKTTGGVKPYTWHWDFADGDTSTAQNATHHFDVAGTYTVTLNVTDSDSPSTTASQSYNVTVEETPTADAGPDKQILCGAGSVLIGGSPTASGGTSPYAYAWTPATGLDNTAIANPSASAAGTYTVTVTDANGCQDTDSVTITVTGGPTANAGVDTGFCAGGNVALSGSASGGTSPYTYDWTGPESHPNTQNPMVSTAGTYTLTVTDNNGCSDTDDIIVGQYPSPTADAGPDVGITAGGSVVIGGTPTASSGTPLYTYNWTPTTGLNDASYANPTASPAVNTTYTVTVTDSNGCTGNDDVTVTVTQGCCIGGFVYRAGTMEPLAGWEVVLEKQTSPWVQVGSAITDANGKYLFCGLGDGEYRVSEVVQPGWSQVSPLPNQHLVTLPLSCCDPLVGPFLNFQNQQGGSSTVGWEASPIDKLVVLAPWIPLFAVIVAGASLLVLRRRRA